MFEAQWWEIVRGVAELAYFVSGIIVAGAAIAMLAPTSLSSEGELRPARGFTPATPGLAAGHPASEPAAPQ